MLDHRVLGLLQYRIATLLLAGRHCLSYRWPFVLAFTEMACEDREKTLFAWSTSKLPQLRQVGP